MIKKWQLQYLEDHDYPYVPTKWKQIEEEIEDQGQGNVLNSYIANMNLCSWKNYTWEDGKAVEALCNNELPVMTLDEAIQYCDDVIENAYNECALEHTQLKLWLLELKAFREGRDNESRCNS